MHWGILAAVASLPYGCNWRVIMPPFPGNLFPLAIYSRPLFVTSNVQADDQFIAKKGWIHVIPHLYTLQYWRFYMESALCWFPGMKYPPPPDTECLLQQSVLLLCVKNSCSGDNHELCWITRGNMWCVLQWNKGTFKWKCCSQVGSLKFSLCFLFIV